MLAMGAFSLHYSRRTRRGLLFKVSLQFFLLECVRSVNQKQYYCWSERLVVLIVEVHAILNPSYPYNHQTRQQP